MFNKAVDIYSNASWFACECYKTKKKGVMIDWRLEKKTRFTFYWVVVKMCVGSIQYIVIETFCPLGTYFDQRVLKHF